MKKKEEINILIINKNSSVKEIQQFLATQLVNDKNLKKLDLKKIEKLYIIVLKNLLKKFHHSKKRKIKKQSQFSQEKNSNQSQIEKTEIQNQKKLIKKVLGNELKAKSLVKHTISSPNVKSIIQAVATILHSQMHEDYQSGKEVPKGSDLHFFSEEKYIEEKPEEFDEARRALLRETPSVDNIYEFMKALYECAKFSPECCIICLVYINRLIAFTGLPLYPTNWRPLILCSLLVAQKVWDDKYLSNADFAFIYPFFVTEEINALEQKFLELLQYNVTVKSALYAKYYFELRALFKNESEFPLTPLDVDQEKQLEARSAQVQNSEKEKATKHSLTYNEKQASKPKAALNV